MNIVNKLKPIPGPGGLCAGVVEVTKEIADSLLAKNEHNRKIKPPTVKLYRDAMSKGDWVLNGESIILAKDGEVLDGQHRLLSVSDSDISTPMLIVYGVSRTAFTSIDTGAKRTAQDALSVEWGNAVQNIKEIALTTKILVKIENEDLLDNLFTSGGVTNAEVLEYANCFKDDLIYATGLIKGYCSQGVKIFPPHIASAILLRDTGDYTHDLNFFEQLYTGLGLVSGSPAAILRNRLEKDMQAKAARGTVFTTYQKTAYLCRALLWHREGKNGVTRFGGLDAAVATVFGVEQ